MDFIIPLLFIAYLSVLIGIGIYFNRKIKNSNDYLIGNHATNYWVTAIAAQASDMGAWLFLGFVAAIYTNGIFEFWAALGLIFFMFLTWQFIAPKLRQSTTTEASLPEFFESHINDTSGTIRVVASAISIVFFGFYISSNLVGLGLLFESAFQIDYHLGICLGLGITVLYTLIGGFAAIAWCDLIQGIYLLVMLLIVPLTAFVSLGSFQTIIDAAVANNVSLSLISSEKSLLSALLLAAGWGLGYFGQPHVLTFFMGIDDPKKIKYAKYVGMSWQILVLSAAASVGMIGIAFFPYPIANKELLFMSMTKALFHPIFVGLILCAILAAVLTTLDSLVLISGSTFANDIYARLNKNVSGKHIILISRLASITISLVATWYAWDGSQTIYNLVNYAWSGLGSSFGPLVIMCLYSPYKVTKNAALAGLITGALVSGFWPYMGTSVLPLIPGFFSSLSIIALISRLEHGK